MIAALRRRHRWMTPVFLGLLPAAALVAGLASRSRAPVTSELPTALTSAAPQPSAVDTDLGHPWNGLGYTARIVEVSGSTTLVVDGVRFASQPDLLLYWSPAEAGLRPTPQPVTTAAAASASFQLPQGSVFLGHFPEADAAIFKIPRELMGQPGRLILYSLPGRQVVSTSQPLIFN